MTQHHYTVPARTLGQAWTSFRTQILRFDGRSTRADYWWIVLLQALAGVAVTAVAVPLKVFGAVSGAPNMELAGSALSTVAPLVLTLVTLSLAVRRFQDTGRPLTQAIPVVLATLLLAVVASVSLSDVLAAGFAGKQGGPAFTAVGVAVLGVALAAAVYGAVVTLRKSDSDNAYGPRQAAAVPSPQTAIAGHPSVYSAR